MQKKVKFTSKFLLAVIAVTPISVGIGVQAYNMQAADAAPKLADNSVRSETIVNGQVKTEDLAPGAVKLNTHRVIPAEGSTIVEPGQPANSFAICPDGEILTGGGFTAGPNMKVIHNHPFSDEMDRWQVGAINQGDLRDGITAWAICERVSP